MPRVSRCALVSLTLLHAPVFAQGTGPVVHDSPTIERNLFVVMKSYPAASLKRGEEGAVRFRVTTDRRGRLDACQIVKSSGYAALDKATCTMLLAGATATPLRSEDGWHVVGNRDGIVEWKLPQGATRPASPPTFTAVRNAMGEPLICKRQEKTGSLVISEKVCLTAEDWNRAKDYAQGEVRRLQSPQGIAFPGGN